MHNNVNKEVQFHATLERNDIRDEEKLELIRNNPGVHFETPPILLGIGRQSRVSALEIVKPSGSVRVIWKRCGVEKELSKDEALALCERLSPYREKLRAHGWNVPNIFYSATVTLKNENVIFSYEELIEAVDAERMFKDEGTAHFERLAVIQKIIHTLTSETHLQLEKRTYLGKQYTQLPYGIDLKLANLILDAKGNLYFVDFFGPKELEEDYRWKSYSPKLDSLSEENLKIVCATREGCILRMLKLALRHLPMTTDYNSYLLHFKEIISHSALPSDEIEFILSELQSGFPLLDKVYDESRV